MTSDITMYKFSAYNAETVYGFGSEESADIYCSFLNEDRESGQYGCSEVEEWDLSIENLAIDLWHEIYMLDVGAPYLRIY